MPEIQIEITASIVAWYGAIIASLVGIFQIIAIWRDRKHIKIKIDEGIRIIGPYGSSPYKEGVDYFAIRIINTGRREVTIASAGARLLNGKYLIPVDILKSGTIILSEGKRYDAFVEQGKLDFSQIAYFYAKDTTDIIYKKNIANYLKQLHWLIKRSLKKKK